MSNDLVHAILWQCMFALCVLMQQSLLLDANDPYTFGGRLPWYPRGGYLQSTHVIMSMSLSSKHVQGF
jgi:hypothetical protein